jgi:hypothetical protein
MNKVKIALCAGTTVFCNFWILLAYLDFSGSLLFVSNAIPGMQTAVELGLGSSLAVVPAVVSYLVVYLILVFPEYERHLPV